MEKITIEAATNEITKWLDYKKVSQNKRESREAYIKILVGAVSEGDLVVNDDFSFTQILKFPFEGSKPLSSLVYKPRLNVNTIHVNLQGVKSDDGDGRIVAHAASLTSQVKEIIKALDTEDYTLASAIVVFFM